MALTKITLNVTLRRLIGRPLVPSWSWGVECATLFLREQMRHAFTFRDPMEAREYLDSLVFKPIDHPDVRVTPNPTGPRGEWFEPAHACLGRTMLYMHGGGYAFHSQGHAPMVALFAEAARARTFSLNYRLTPESPHPAQLEDAVAAYRWLLESGVASSQLVIAGDSAGGHLTLMLLLELQRQRLPQPALAIGICPWTDIGARGASLFANDRYDWVLGEMALQFGHWYQHGTGLSREALSPISGQFAGLAPIYLQAGDKEILVDMIRDFAEIARGQGADVSLDVWPDMTHDFQAFGSMLPESREALAKFGAAVDLRIPH